MAKSKKAPHLAAVRDGAGRRCGGDASSPRSPSWSGTRPLLRIDCVRMLAVAKSGHLDSSLSAADIVAALYYRVLRHDPQRPQWPGRDRFVLSKGHAAPIQYAALARHGYFPMEDLMGLRKLDAHLQGHPDMTRTPGVEVSTGSLGPGPFDVARDRARAAAGRDRRGARLRADVGRRLPGGPVLGGRDGGGALRRPQPDRDRRLQPPPDRRHDRGGHGHRRRAQEVRGVRVGRGRDRRPRHDGRRRGARVEPHARAAGGDRLPDDEGQGRVADGGPASASTASRPRPSRPSRR